MKVRVQFTIDSDRKRRATERARESGLSFAEYAAKLIKKDLKPTKDKTSVEAIFNLGSSSGSDIARNKKQMIADAISSWHRN
jgi:hypothetical protein